jgi:hypothetical protein
MRDHRLTAAEAIARDQNESLRAAANELERTGTVRIVTESGQISARIIRFRWGDDVVEITRSRGGLHNGFSGSRLARSTGSARGDILVRQLAAALAALEPPSAPGP